MRTLDAKDRAIERKFIADGAWPLFPMLPVKRDASVPDNLGVILWRMGIENGPIFVYLANMIALSEKANAFHEKTGKRARYSDVLADVRMKEYATLDDFFDAGWRGD